ncbi:MAG TPA: TatD family hydrolase [Candidatus Paceibacterota bacterium]|nr:TatD family hydrolase [Candidatus Paceibacterota bacterium]
MEPVHFFDAHTHLQFPPYDADREEVFARAKAAGVKMINVGTQYSTSYAGVDFARKHAGDAWAAVGFHPAHFSVNWFHDKHEQAAVEREELNVENLRKLAFEPETVAVGECGLDYFRIKDEESKRRQKEGFLAQIELAHEAGKPLMIHCRAAFSDLLDVLSFRRSSLTANPGTVHFFTGTPADARKLLDLGFSFTFGGVITFARDYDEAIRAIPLDRILSETDAPYVSPAPYRGKRNEPAYVVETVKKLAELKGVSMEEMAARIRENANRIFGI